MRIACVLLLLTSIAFAPRSQSAQRPEIREHIDAYVKALSSGSAEQYEAMAKQHFTPQLLAKSAERRAQMVTGVHNDFGEITVANEVMTSPTRADLTMASRTNSMPLTITLDFEAEAPFRITQTELRAGGPAGGRGGRGGPPPLPAPPINGKMTGAELSAALDAYLAGLARANDFAGVVLVAKDGSSLFEKPYGLVERERNTPMSADLRFNYASIGKAFTKAAIGQLIAAGKLKLTDTLGAVLSDYPNADAKPATIDQLLAFRVGIADFFGEAFERSDKSRFQSNRDYYQFVAPQPLTFKPGERTEYCNGCYVVLGEIIAKVSGVPYERYIQDHVFTPAGMKTAGFLSYGDANVAPGFTRPNPAAPWTPADGRHGRRGSAAGGSFGTARDLLAFDNAVRTHVLFDAKTTAWFLGSPDDASRPRALGGYGIAGGAPGSNASLESGAGWTIVAVGNLDPPNAVRVGTTLAQALTRER